MAWAWMEDAPTGQIVITVVMFHVSVMNESTLVPSRLTRDGPPTPPVYRRHTYQVVWKARSNVTEP